LRKIKLKNEENLKKCIEIIKNSLKNGYKVLICGNGGSAADAQHFAAEIVGRFKLERKGFPAIALTTDTSILTAIGNDYGFDKIFERQVEALGKEGDVLVGIYLKQVGDAITNQCEFSIEEFRRLRESSSFQKSLEQAFRILANGETEEISFQFLEKKFKKNTNEYIALNVVVNEVKKMMENS